MYLERMTADTHPRWGVAKKIYEESFPSYDRRSIRRQLEAIKEPDCYCMAIVEGEETIGILWYWEKKTVKYLEYFAILPTLRGKNYGSKALQLFCQSSKVVLLEIEPPIDTVSEKRLAFYERLGFRLQSFEHLHPPFTDEAKAYELKVMTYEKDILVEQYQDFYAYLSNHIMAFNDRKNG